MLLKFEFQFALTLPDSLIYEQTIKNRENIAVYFLYH